MRKTTLLLSLIATGALLASGCEPGSKTAAGASATGLVDDGTSADTGSEVDYDVEPGDAAKLPLQVSWKSDGADTAATEMLEFAVENTTDREQEVSIAVVASCQLGDAELPLGESVLGPKDLVNFAVHADDLPIRSTVFLTRLSVKLTRTINRIDHPVQISRHYAGPLYRHEAGFETVRPFSTAKCQEELGGVLLPSTVDSSSASASELADTALGEKSDGAGGWIALKPSSRPGMVAYDEAGNVIGVVTGYSIGVGDASDASDEGAIVTPEPEETEVSDE